MILVTVKNAPKTIDFQFAGYNNIPLYKAPKIINFEEELVIPRFNLVELYAQENLLNDKGQFFVYASEKHPYLRELVKLAQQKGLTVDGDGTAPSKGGDIRECPKGGMITFGSSSRFDMNWVRRDGYFAEKGFAPVYDIVADWKKILKALDQYVERKRKRNFLFDVNNNDQVQYHARFAVVNGQVRTYGKEKVMVTVPTDLAREFDVDLCMRVNVIRNW